MKEITVRRANSCISIDSIPGPVDEVLKTGFLFSSQVNEGGYIPDFQSPASPIPKIPGLPKAKFRSGFKRQPSGE